MAKRNLTVLFGADTSKLTKALGGLRKKINGAFKGMLSLKGMAVAGIGGFGISQAIGLMMNLSPAFANAMLKMREPLMNLAGAVADTIAPWFQSFAEWLTSNDLAAGISDWWADLKEGFGIVVDFLAGVPALLVDGFNDIVGAFSDIYDALMILWRSFDKKVTKAVAGAATGAIFGTETGLGAVQAFGAAEARGESGIVAAGKSLMGSLLGFSTRGPEPSTTGGSDR